MMPEVQLYIALAVILICIFLPEVIGRYTYRTGKLGNYEEETHRRMRAETMEADLARARQKEKELRELLELKSAEMAVCTARLHQKNELIDRLKLQLDQLNQPTPDRLRVSRPSERRHRAGENVLLEAA
ncbi:hypothetical protein [Larkinella soli]|uniref:hypothetical protein n=1 Tax=Larkinella soli TaxID=1770527 RepID=UPI000FFB7135|nr:hypothetical protein [Larkinella soli]